MPHNLRDQTIYASTGNPDTVNDAALYKGGELGGSLSRNNREYQLVQLDTGATSATAIGVVAATQLAFWKDKVNYIVTNDTAQALGADGAADEHRNFVAGIFRAAVTAGRFCFVLKRGEQINVLAQAGTYVAGESAVAFTGTTADITRIAAGTAPSSMLVGIIRGARAGGVVPVDVHIYEVE